MEKFTNYIKTHKAFLISITIYIAITLIRLINHQPWYDEAHAWTVAKETSFIELFEALKYEGHTLPWFLLIRPFAKLDLFYPYSMFLINWTFCLAALCLMWNKAPFNNLIKILITFAYPYFIIYPILARCYSIGILIFFVIAALYKKRFERPYLFSSLIIFAANTSVMAATGACALGLVFFFELIRKYKSNEIKLSGVIIPFSIMLFGSILFFAQLCGASSASIAGINGYNKGLSANFFNSVFIFNHNINLFLLALIAFSIIQFLFKDKRIAFFLMVSYLMLITIFHFVYAGSIWHYYFFLTYLIIAFWMYLDTNKVDKKSISYKFSIISLILMLFLMTIDNRVPFKIFTSESKTISDILLNDNNFKKSRVIIYNLFDLKILPYMSKDEEIEIYDYCTADKPNYKVERANGNCQIGNSIQPIKILELISTQKKTFSIVAEEDLPAFKAILDDDKIMAGDYEINFIPYKYTKFNYIFENSITKVKNSK